MLVSISIPTSILILISLQNFIYRTVMPIVQGNRRRKGSMRGTFDDGQCRVSRIHQEFATGPGPGSGGLRETADLPHRGIRASFGVLWASFVYQSIPGPRVGTFMAIESAFAALNGISKSLCPSFDPSFGEPGHPSGPSTNGSLCRVRHDGPLVLALVSAGGCG